MATPTPASGARSTTATTPPWRLAAACRNDPQPNRWVDLPPLRSRGQTNPAYTERVDTLSAICAGCPVQTQCLAESVPADVTGFFAGTDDYARAEMREGLGLPHPDWQTDESVAARAFRAHRLAREDLTNSQIAARLGVTRMTISRFFTYEG